MQIFLEFIHQVEDFLFTKLRIFRGERKKVRGVAKWVSLLRRGKSPISLKREYFLRESHIFNNISEWYNLLLMIFLSEIALFLPHFRRKYCICQIKIVPL